MEETPELSCGVHGCAHTTNNTRHRYCDDHYTPCINRADWYITFGKHKGKKWYDVLNSDRKYVKWALYKADLFDTDTRNPHYLRNIIMRAYLENEIRHLELR